MANDIYNFKNWYFVSKPANRIVKVENDSIVGVPVCEDGWNFVTPDNFVSCPICPDLEDPTGRKANGLNYCDTYSANSQNFKRHLLSIQRRTGLQLWSLNRAVEKSKSK